MDSFLFPSPVSLCWSFRWERKEIRAVVPCQPGQRRVMPGRRLCRPGSAPAILGRRVRVRLSFARALLTPGSHSADSRWKGARLLRRKKSRMSVPFLLRFQKPGQGRVLVGSSLPAAQAQKHLPHTPSAKASARPSPLPPPHPVLSGYLPRGPPRGVRSAPLPGDPSPPTGGVWLSSLSSC